MLCRLSLLWWLSGKVRIVMMFTIFLLQPLKSARGEVCLSDWCVWEESGSIRSRFAPPLPLWTQEGFMVNRPEGPTLTKSYDREKQRSSFWIWVERGMRRRREAGSFKLRRKGTQDRDFFMDCLCHFWWCWRWDLAWGSVKRKTIV